MAFKLNADSSEPRNKVIAFYATLTVFVLFGLQFAFQSYFHMMIDEVHAERAAIATLPRCAANAPATDVNVNCRRTTSSMQELQDMHAHEAEMLNGAHGATAIDNAMQALAQNRQNAAIVPAASTEMAPVKGWEHIPHFVTTARPTMDLTAAPAAAPTAEPAPVDPLVDPAAAGEGAQAAPAENPAHTAAEHGNTEHVPGAAAP